MKKSILKTKLRSLIILLLCIEGFALSVLAQGTIFPGQVGQELINNLQQTYTPLTVLSYDVARDTMYAIMA